MSSQVINKISDLIKDDPSLDRIKYVKELLIKEKSTIDYQLNKESNSRFKDVLSSVEISNSTQKSVKLLKEKLNTIGQLSMENRSSIERYEVINTVTKIHELMEKTTHIYDKILEFNKLTQHINHLLDTELSDEVLIHHCPNLLSIHFMLTKARDFQEQMTLLANIANDDVKITIRKVFSGLSECINKFDKLVESIAYDLIEAVRTDNKSLLIRICKIIDLEEREDLKIIATRNIIKAKELESESSRHKKLPNKVELQENIMGPALYPTDHAIFNEIMNGTIQTRINPRGYKSLFFECIQKSIKEMFVEVRNEYSGDKKFDSLKNLDWVFNELLIAKDHLSLICPRSWKIFDKYYEYYYNELNKLVLELINSEPETLIILDILDYDKNFKNVMKEDFGFSKSQAISIIGDKDKEQLLSDYLDLILMKMSEWIGNLEKTELNIFIERNTPPYTDSENLFYLDGTNTCFQMFTQQVEVAAGSGQAKILVGVIQNFCGLLCKRQSKWINIIRNEVIKTINYNHKYEQDPEIIAKEDETTGGLIEYLIAVANDQMRAADYAVAISQKYSVMVSKVHERTITNEIETTLDGFAQVAKESTIGIIQIMFDDLRKPYTEIFSKNWYSGNQAQQIVDTLFEYLTEIKEQINPFVYSTLIEDVVEEAILKFIECLKYNHSFKNKHNRFLECMKRDFEIFYKLFIQFLLDEEKSIIDDKFKLMEFFMDFACGSVNDILHIWEECLKVYWDCPINFLNNILKNRKDIDSSTTKQLITSAQKMLQDPGRPADINTLDMQPTFISRLNIQ